MMQPELTRIVLGRTRSVIQLPELRICTIFFFFCEIAHNIVVTPVSLPSRDNEFLNKGFFRTKVETITLYNHS